MDISWLWNILNEKKGISSLKNVTFQPTLCYYGAVLKKNAKQVSS